jgi:putative oxidoreductase
VSLGSPRIDVALLVLRLSGAGLAIFHGWPKLAALLGGTSRFSEGLASMGLPFPVAMAWAAALVETFGGLLVLVGFGTRIAAILCAVTMVVAAFVRHHAFDLFLWKVGVKSVTPEDAKAWGSPELALVYLLAFVTLALAGAGRLSLDRGKR